MRRSLLLAIVSFSILGLNGCAWFGSDPQQTVESTRASVFFELESDEITSKAAARIKDLADVFRGSDRFRSILLVGYQAAVETEGLSRQRQLVVTRAFNDNGIRSANILLQPVDAVASGHQTSSDSSLLRVDVHLLR